MMNPEKNKIMDIVNIFLIGFFIMFSEESI